MFRRSATHNDHVLLRGVGVGRAVRSTVVLGAGASRGASFADSKRQVLPPLDADFFRQAQRLDETAYNAHVREVIEFVRAEYGSTRLPTLEALFTQLQGYEQFLQQFSTRPGRRPERYKKQLGYLLELIPLVFKAAMAGQRCLWHDRIAYALRKGDSLISFNYDALIDESVRRWAKGLWKADRGYGARSLTRWGFGQRTRLLVRFRRRISSGFSSLTVLCTGRRSIQGRSHYGCGRTPM